MLKRIIKSIIVIIAFQTLAFCQEEAKKSDGKKVLLYENGTWLNVDSIPLHNIRDSSILKLEIPKTNKKDKKVKEHSREITFLVFNYSLI